MKARYEKEAAMQKRKEEAEKNIPPASRPTERQRMVLESDSTRDVIFSGLKIANHKTAYDKMEAAYAPGFGIQAPQNMAFRAVVTEVATNAIDDAGDTKELAWDRVYFNRAGTGLGTHMCM